MMNNDQQIQHLDSRLDKLEHNDKIILDNLFIRLKVLKVIMEHELAAGGDVVLNIVGVMETENGVIIRVR